MPGNFWFRHEKKEHRPKLLNLDIFQWGRGLPRQGVGVKKPFGMSLETREIKLFGAGYPGILLGYPGGARKALRKKKFVLKLWPLF